jgi:hypothetical protein
MTTSDRYDVLCDVIADWLEAHKALTKAKLRYEGISTPKAARHEYLYQASLYGRARNGRALYETSTGCATESGRRARTRPRRSRVRRG